MGLRGLYCGNIYDDSKDCMSNDCEFAIETNGLTKRYRAWLWKLKDEAALDSLTLRVPMGTVYGFLGPNGAGKTTTIRCLTDLIRPTSGTAQVLGESCGSVAVRERIGYLPDAPQFGSHLTAYQFLSVCARLLKISSGDRRRRIDEVLESVRMSKHAKERLGNFSRGMIQRIGIAQALLNHPALLILDEPLVGLDPHGRKELLEIVREQKERGVSVFFCSHILSDVEKLCDSVGILRGGRLQCSGSLEDVLQSRGIRLMISPDASSFAQGLLADADSSERLSDGGWRLEIADQTRADEIRERSIPDGVEIQPRRESLDELFFRIVGATDVPGGDAQRKHEDEEAAAI